MSMDMMDLDLLGAPAPSTNKRPTTIRGGRVDQLRIGRGDAPNPSAFTPIYDVILDARATRHAIVDLANKWSLEPGSTYFQNREGWYTNRQNLCGEDRIHEVRLCFQNVEAIERKIADLQSLKQATLRRITKICLESTLEPRPVETPASIEEALETL